MRGVACVLCAYIYIYIHATNAHTPHSYATTVACGYRNKPRVRAALYVVAPPSASYLRSTTLSFDNTGTTRDRSAIP